MIEVRDIRAARRLVSKLCNFQIAEHALLSGDYSAFCNDGLIERRLLKNLIVRSFDCETMLIAVLSAIGVAKSSFIPAAR
jgi:hypothetical protein